MDQLGSKLKVSNQKQKTYLSALAIIKSEKGNKIMIWKHTSSTQAKSIKRE